jgi:glyoxylase I family protein
MSKITGAHHIAIRTTQFDRCIQFYTQTLGLSVKSTWTTKTGQAALVEISHGTYMEIFERPATIEAGPVILHFCLRTDDVVGMTERVRGAGYRVTTEPLTLDLETSIGVVKLHLAFVEGPDGESIELMASDKF